MFFAIFLLTCYTLTLSAAAELGVMEAKIELINNNTTARGTFKIRNTAERDYKIAITKQLFGQYEELVSWDLELSQKYKDRGDVSITAGGHNLDNTREYVLVIGNVTLDDYAVYRCRIYETFNQIDYHFVENAKGPAIFAENSRYFTENYPICSSVPAANVVVAGSEITLTCNHAGAPPLTLQWHNANGTLGDFMEDRGLNTTIQVSYNQQRVILEKVDDGASFTCTVSSSNGAERQCVIGPFHVTSTTQNNTAVDSQQDQEHDYPVWLLAISAVTTGLFVLALIAIFYLIIRIRKQTDSEVVAGREHRQRSDPNPYIDTKNAQQTLTPVAEENGPNNVESRDLTSDPGAAGHHVPHHDREVRPSFTPAS